MSMYSRKYPISSYNENYLKRLNSKNATVQMNEILNNQNEGFYNPEDDLDEPEMFDELLNNNNTTGKRRSGGVRIIINKSVINQLSADLQNANNVGNSDEQQSDYYDIYGNPMRSYGTRGGGTRSHGDRGATGGDLDITGVGQGGPQECRAICHACANRGEPRRETESL